MFDLPKGPFCQSCGIPMDKAEPGTEKDSSKSELYCAYCYKDGEFVNKEITMDLMIEKVSGIMTQQMGIPSFIANTIVQSHIPNLKRWNN